MNATSCHIYLCHSFYFPHINKYKQSTESRVTAFGDDLNIVNVSGIIVVFCGVFLYKVTLHLSNSEKENTLTNDTQGNGDGFLRISSGDMSDVFSPEGNVSPRRDYKKRNSDPDIALSFRIDDIDDDVEALSINGTSPLRERGNFEVDNKDEESTGII